MEEHVVEECRDFPYARAYEMAPEVLREYVYQHGGDPNSNDKIELIRRLQACFQDPDGRSPGHRRPLPGERLAAPHSWEQPLPQRVTHEYGQLLDAAHNAERRVESMKRVKYTIDSLLSEAAGSSTALRFAFVEPVKSQAYMGVDRALYADPRPSSVLSRQDRRMGPLLQEAVWKSKFYGAFVLNRRVVLHAIDATPARWRGDAGSSPLDRARTAAPSPRNDFVKNCRAPDALVDFHTGEQLFKPKMGRPWRSIIRSKYL